MSSTFKTICDIRHFLKQHKLLFLQSNTTILNAFNLIHTKINIPSIHEHKYFLNVVNDHIRNKYFLNVVNNHTIHTYMDISYQTKI